MLGTCPWDMGQNQNRLYDPLASNSSETNQETCGKETLTLRSRTANRTVFLFTPNAFQSFFRGLSQRIAGTSTHRFVKLCVVAVWAKVVSRKIVVASFGVKRFRSSQFAIRINGISVTDNC